MPQAAPQITTSAGPANASRRNSLSGVTSGVGPRPPSQHAGGVIGRASIGGAAASPSGNAIAAKPPLAPVPYDSKVSSGKAVTAAKAIAKDRSAGLPGPQPEPVTGHSVFRLASKSSTMMLSSEDRAADEAHDLSLGRGRPVNAMPAPAAAPSRKASGSASSSRKTSPTSLHAVPGSSSSSAPVASAAQRPGTGSAGSSRKTSPTEPHKTTPAPHLPPLTWLQQKRILDGTQHKSLSTRRQQSRDAGQAQLAEAAEAQRDAVLAAEVTGGRKPDPPPQVTAGPNASGLSGISGLGRPNAGFDVEPNNDGVGSLAQAFSALSSATSTSASQARRH